MLECFLERNELTNGVPDDMRAQTVSAISHNQAGVIDRILKSGAVVTDLFKGRILLASRPCLVRSVGQTRPGAGYGGTAR
ncbi:MAG: hypothetical protein LBD58_13450 [Treponema sp.]|jgi:hypothetical protein|nr:hypothetical protein [Treponema sp.]